MPKIPPAFNQSALSSLRRSWMLFALLGLVFLVLGAFVLWQGWGSSEAWRWAALTALTLVYLSAVLWHNLELNHRAGEEKLLPGLGWGNWMTLLRGILTAGVVGFLFSPIPPGWLAWLPGILYSLAITLDGFDGYLARKTDHATRLGSLLDISFDGLGVLGAALLLVQYGQVPAWYGFVALSRYLFLAGEWILHRFNRPVYPLPASVQRRLFASLQFAFIAVLLYPVFTPPLTWVAAITFGLPFLIAFGRDFLFVCGILRPSLGPSALARYLPVFLLGLRLAMVILTALTTRQMLAAGLSHSWSGQALIAGQLLTATLVLLGVASRISAGLALGLVGLTGLLLSPSVVQIFQVAGYTAIVYLGGGPYTLWSPEEAWYKNQSGLKRNKTAPNVKHETFAQTR